MTRRIAAVTCCLLLFQSTAFAADGSVPNGALPAIADALSKPRPIRDASLSTATAVRAEVKGSPRLGQDGYPDDRSWVERHPVWTGAMAGFGAGFGMTYLTTHDDRDEFIQIMSPGAAGLFWGGVCAGVGALTGWAIGRNHDE